MSDNYDDEKTGRIREALKRKRAEWNLLNGGDEDDSPADENYSAADDNGEEAEVLTPEAIKEREEAGVSSKAESEEESLYNAAEESDSLLARTRAKIQANKKKTLIGGGVIAGIGGIGVTIFVAMIPLKVMIVAENLQKRYFASSESAVGSRLEHYFDRYLVERVVPNLNSTTGACSSTRTMDRTCYRVVPNTGPVGTLFNAWSEARLETKMADKYGFEVAKTSSNTYILRVNGQSSNIDIEGFRKNPGSGLFQAEGGRNDIRLAVREALAGETKWKRAMYRYKIGGLLDRKYGIRRCVFFCNTKDKLADWKGNKKSAFTAVIARRVKAPRAQAVGLAMACIFSTECDNDPSGTDGNDSGDLEKKDKLQRNIEKYLQKEGFEYTKDSVAKLAGLVSDIGDAGGFGKYIMKTVLEKVFGELVAKVAAKAIPIIGWIDMIAQFTSKIKNAGAKFKKWAYAVNSAIMVRQGILYLSSAAEMKNGKTNLGLVSSVASSLDGMEKSPLYESLMGSGSRSIADVFMPSAFALQEADTSKYTCEDGNQVPTGELVCEEESLRFNNILTQGSDLFKKPGLEQVGAIADGWNAAPGKVFNAAGNLFGNLVQQFPGVDALNEKAAELTQPLMEAASEVIPDPLGDNPSGGRNFNVAAGGINIAGNQYAQYGVGGQLLSDAEIGAIRQNQMDEETQLFSQKPLFARMFDTESQYSLVGQMAMAMPTNISTYTNDTMASIFSSPVSFFANIGSMFSSRQVKAATGRDPWGVLQYGVKLGDPILTAERPADCDAYNKAWAENTKVDPDSGLDVHDTVNACLLDDAAIGSGGAAFDTSVLKPEDLSQPTQPGSAPASPTTTPPLPADGGLPTGDAKSLAAQLLASSNVTIEQRDQMQNIANGSGPCPKVNASYTFDTQLLRVLVGLSSKYKFKITSLHRGCTGSTVGAGKNSRHWKGKAVDISGSTGINGIPLTSFDAYDESGVIQGFINQAKALLPNGCELGVPNSRYRDTALNQQPAGCSNVMLDRPETTKATGPHIHLAAPL